MKFNKIFKIHTIWALFILLFFLIIGCSKIDPATGEKILIEQDGFKKARESADKGGGIFGTLGKDVQNQQGQGNINFGNSNVLWRATLKSLDFLPLINADYSGGIIVYDWYSEDLNSKEQIKVSIKFLSNELRSDSIQVIVHKKTCENISNCITLKLENKFSSEIKEKILLTARSMKIEESKNNPKK